MLEIRKSLELNFLTCKHCQKPYKEPKSLICLHSFCQACLEEMINRRKAEEEARELEAYKLLYNASSTTTTTHESSYRRKWSSRFRNGDYSGTTYGLSRFTRHRVKDDIISCPICHKKTTIPSGGITNLPVDQLADKLASLVDRMPTFPICDVCTKEPLLNENFINQLKLQQCNLQAHFAQLNCVESNHCLYGREDNNINASNGNTFSEEESDAEDEGVSLDKLSLQDSAEHSDTFSPRINHHSRHQYQLNDSNYKRHDRKVVSMLKQNRYDGPRPAVVACLECGKRLCTYCSELHSRMPVTSNHVLIQLEQMEELRCDRHPRELKRFFCLTCRAYICIICAFESDTQNGTTTEDISTYSGHSDHDILSIRQAVAAYQDQLNIKSSETQSQINRIELFLTGLQVCESQIRKIRSSIDTTTKAFIEYIEKQRVTLYEQLDSMVGVDIDELTNECDRLTRAASSWYSFLNDDRVTSRLDLLDPVIALTEAGPMLDRLNRCLQLASTTVFSSPEWKPLLLQLTAAENSVHNNNQNGPTIKSQHEDQKHIQNGTSIAGEQGTDPRVNYWQSCFGHFEPGEVNLGRIITSAQLANEAKARSVKYINTYVQTGPELVKSLPPPKGALLHRAIQVDFLNANLDDRATQTEHTPSVIQLKIDSGTQYQSSDINPPVSIYRSIKQILVQK